MHDHKPPTAISVKNYFAKRTNKQRNLDRDFIRSILQEDFYITKLSIHEQLNKFIQARGDSYTLSYDFVTEEVNKIKEQRIKESGIIIENEINKSLELIEENIKLCLNEIQVRFTTRTEVTETQEELRESDLSGITTQEKVLLKKVKDKVKKTKTKSKNISAGSNINEPMRLLEMWLKAKREILGLDAPKRIDKKTTTELEIQNFTSLDFETSLLMMGMPKERIQKLLLLINEKF